MTDDRSQPPPSQRFATLDDYLAHRRELGAQDHPFYVETAPGVYRLTSGRPIRGEPPPFIGPPLTRAALMARYGFTR